MPEGQREEKDSLSSSAAPAGRLRGRRDIDELFRTGKRLQGRRILIIYRDAPDGGSRYAVFVPKRLGTAVGRNRARRVLREALRTSRSPALAGRDTVVLCRHRVDEDFNSGARTELLELLDRLERIK